jgi:acetoin utilization deacetylase AcuC-like enzyme/GNAT superfamily N-acetyltransferase
VFRIRRIFDNVRTIDREEIRQVQAILKEQFHLLPQKDIDKLPDMLLNPLKHRFRAILFVADNLKGDVLGFALLLHDQALKFCYLDFLSAAKGLTGRGIGGYLYGRVRDEALALKSVGIFFECLPDDPELSRDPEIRKENAARLSFYERFGARPIAGTDYETPVKPGGDNPPYLVFDGLGRDKPLRRSAAKRIVRAILYRKYRKYCPKDYIDRVVASFREDPVRLRKPQYVRIPVSDRKPEAVVAEDTKILLVAGNKHAIHHVRERGYVESPVRVRTILNEIEHLELFRRIPARHFSESHILKVHDRKYVSYFKKACRLLEPGESIYPYVFPIRNAARPPRETAVRAGYYCIDTFTPLNGNAYLAAREAVDCALTGARRLREGDLLVYALVRPPGHHAERGAFGGFCYFNSAAVAAEFLRPSGSVAILDLDYHHGNGQQEIFYRRKSVLTVSIHGHPRFAYPYFNGFENERGQGGGREYNLNLPLPEEVGGRRYRKALDIALRKIRRFKPSYLIVALGLDTARGDPTGTWMLGSRDFEENGLRIGMLKLPTLVVQEGGYNHRNLGVNARHFFIGLHAGMHGPS